MWCIHYYFSSSSVTNRRTVNCNVIVVNHVKCPWRACRRTRIPPRQTIRIRFKSSWPFTELRREMSFVVYRLFNLFDTDRTYPSVCDACRRIFLRIRFARKHYAQRILLPESRGKKENNHRTKVRRLGNTNNCVGSLKIYYLLCRKWCLFFIRLRKQVIFNMFRISISILR